MGHTTGCVAFRLIARDIRIAGAALRYSLNSRVQVAAAPHQTLRVVPREVV
jgi:hypothetical protein